MLALQALTPADLVRAVLGVRLPEARKIVAAVHRGEPVAASSAVRRDAARAVAAAGALPALTVVAETASAIEVSRSEEHTSELQSLTNLVCRLLLEKKKLTPHLFRGRLDHFTVMSLMGVRVVLLMFR